MVLDPIEHVSNERADHARRIRTANILLLKAKALANEVAKNLVLAGIGSITVVDHDDVTEDDLGSQFFVSEDHVGKNRAEAAAPQIQKLNPRVKVTALTTNPATLEPDFFIPFTLVIATDLDFNTLSTINAITRVYNKPFYAAGAHGMYGYIFADLIMHQYQIERTKSNVPTVIGPESSQRSILSTTEKQENGKTIELVSKSELYSPLLLVNSSPLPLEITNSTRRMKNVTPLLPCLRALWEFEKSSNGALPGRSRQELQTFTRFATEKVRELQLPTDMLKSEFLRSFLQNLGGELAPVTAFLGGMLAQDAINVLGQRQQPIQNLVLFDGEDSKGPMYALHPQYDATLDMSGMNGLNGNGMTMGMGMGDLAGANGMMPMGMDGSLDMSMGMGMGMPGLNGMNGMGMSPMLDMNAMGSLGMDGMTGMDMTGMNGMMNMDMNGMVDMSNMSGIPGMTMNANGIMQMPGGTETSLDIPVAGESTASAAVETSEVVAGTSAVASEQPPPQTGESFTADGPQEDQKVESKSVDEKPASEQQEGEKP